MKTVLHTQTTAQIESILRKYNVQRASLYGSFARGENTPQSDIDILVELPEGSTLFDLVGLENDLSESLQKKVDVATYRSVNPRIKKYIRNDVVEIFNAS